MKIFSYFPAFCHFKKVRKEKYFFPNLVLSYYFKRSFLYIFLRNNVLISNWRNDKQATSPVAISRLFSSVMSHS